MNALSTRYASPVLPLIFLERDDLSSHLTLCNRQRGAWFVWQCQADAAHSFVAPRIMTFALVAALVAYLLVQLIG
jgi:hypothetical protein